MRDDVNIRERASADVKNYLRMLEHPMKAEVAELHAALLDADDRITDTVKWNAPNFRWNGADRVTFKLQPKNCFQIVLHRGARPGESRSLFSNETAMIKWAAVDRGIITVADAADFAARKQELVAVAIEWMRS